MNEVTQLEDQREQYQAQIERRDAAIRLSQNADFKKLILTSFCRDECARYAQASADPSLSEREQKDALSMAQAAGHLRRFLSVQIRMGHAAEGEMVELEEALSQARAEEGAA